MSVKLSVTGVKEIDQVLKGLPRQLQDKVLAQAHADAAKPLVERAKNIVPKRKGNLRDSIGTEKLGKRGNEIGQVQVGPRRSKRWLGHGALLVEFGTKKRATKKGANRGVMPKKPFMFPAFRQTKQLVEGRIAKAIGQKLYNFMKRTLK
ncbi:MAG: HK97-gp10 family putative phage morphogenesis protein [Leptolyngbyaceae bacterium]|nr:HK97-gp10 family putative phage morphogenesis protein [Leptolyngbyaceae bacterium]